MAGRSKAIGGAFSGSVCRVCADCVQGLCKVCVECV